MIEFLTNRKTSRVNVCRHDMTSQTFSFLESLSRHSATRVASTLTRTDEYFITCRPPLWRYQTQFAEAFISRTVFTSGIVSSFVCIWRRDTYSGTWRVFSWGPNFAFEGGGRGRISCTRLWCVNFLFGVIVDGVRSSWMFVGDRTRLYGLSTVLGLLGSSSIWWCRCNEVRTGELQPEESRLRCGWIWCRINRRIWLPLTNSIEVSNVVKIGVNLNESIDLIRYLISRYEGDVFAVLWACKDARSSWRSKFGNRRDCTCAASDNRE